MIYIGGLYPLVRHHNPQAPLKVKVLLIGDSFAVRSRPSSRPRYGIWLQSIRVAATPNIRDSPIWSGGKNRIS